MHVQVVILKDLEERDFACVDSAGVAAGIWASADSTEVAVLSDERSAAESARDGVRGESDSNELLLITQKHSILLVPSQ